jgi:hypothetical protein
VEFDTASIVISMLVGTVGFGIFIFGKKQQRHPQLVVGLAMMVYPYFIPSALAMALIAVALIALLVLAVKRGW